jgi:phage terminase large subunit-like protein
MVEEVLRGIDANVSYLSVWASRRKIARAEPIASLYEQKKVHHLRRPEQIRGSALQSKHRFQACEMGVSPDRADACIWGLTELSENAAGGLRAFFMSL